MHHMQRHSEPEGCAQRVRTDRVAAMDDRPRPVRLRFGYGRRERLRAIVTV